MANKWKYATLDAETRLQMLRNGNKDVFDEEVARTKSVTKARKELGLDTTEQEKWMDTVGYNYNLYNAKMSGENTANVSKTGYAKLYLTDKAEKSTKSSPNYFSGSSTNYSDYAFYRLGSAENAAKKAINSKYDALLENAKAEFEKQYSYLEEALINNGTSLESDKASLLLDEFRKDFEHAYAEYDKERKEELSGSAQKYANLKSTLLSHKNNGMTGLRLIGAANEMILKNAEADGYDANGIIMQGIGLGGSTSEKVPATKETAEAEKSVGTEKQSTIYIPGDFSGTSIGNILPFTKERVKSALEKLGIEASDIESLSEKLYEYIKSKKN